MDYKKLSDCWNGISVYNLNGDNKMFREDYKPVTMSYPQYKNYLASGRNAFDASGGVATGQVSGGVFSGHVRQNFQTAANGNISTPVLTQTSGLGWL